MPVPRTKDGRVDGGKIYRRGRAYEYKIVHQLRDQGFIAFRSAGSHSPIDVVGINVMTREIRLIQCKAGTSLSTKARENIAEANKGLNGLFDVVFQVL